MDYEDRLTDPAAAALFLYPPDAAALEMAAGRVGLTRWRVDLTKAAGKADLLHAFDHALRFKRGFGANWDALHDILTERALNRPAGVMLTLENCAPLVAAAPVEFARALDVLDAVREDCRDEDVAFWVFVEGLAARSAEDYKLPIFASR
jgi:RNAse (barnase) inhibitor barstar